MIHKDQQGYWDHSWGDGCGTAWGNNLGGRLGGGWGDGWADGLGERLRGWQVGMAGRTVWKCNHYNNEHLMNKDSYSL